MLIYGRGERVTIPACLGHRCAFIPLLSSSKLDTPTAVEAGHEHNIPALVSDADSPLALVSPRPALSPAGVASGLVAAVPASAVAAPGVEVAGARGCAALIRGGTSTRPFLTVAISLRS
jgi:hypothetical protein